MAVQDHTVTKYFTLFVLQHVWDELDAWHSRLMLLENEVQDLAEQHPDQAHLLMDQLTQPLQLYQNAAQKAEQRTTFLSKVRHIMLCLRHVTETTVWIITWKTWKSVFKTSILLLHIFFTPLTDPGLSSGLWRHHVQRHLLVKWGPVVAQCFLLIHNIQKPPESRKLPAGQRCQRHMITNFTISLYFYPYSHSVYFILLLTQAFWHSASYDFILNPELQLVLDDSERLRNNLQDFRPVLDEISAVCDMTTQEERLDHNDQQVQNMQHKIVEPLEQLLQAVVVRNTQISGCWWPQTAEGGNCRDVFFSFVKRLNLTPDSYLGRTKSVESFSWECFLIDKLVLWVVYNLDVWNATLLHFSWWRQ